MRGNTKPVRVSVIGLPVTLKRFTVIFLTAATQQKSTQALDDNGGWHIDLQH